MRSRIALGGLLLQLCALAKAWETSVDQRADNRQVCSGMYSATSWGGAIDPYILVKFEPMQQLDIDDKPVGLESIVSLAIFEWKDFDKIGKEVSPSEPKVYICDGNAVDRGDCSEKDLGAFITSGNSTGRPRSQIVSLAVHLSTNDSTAINYPLKNTGYYCVTTASYSAVMEYQAIVVFQNAYGELPAAQIAKLPFYAAVTIVYAFAAMAWGALYWLNRHDILAVQNYITAILVFLVVEMFMTWLFYDYQNRHGLNAGAKVLLVVVSILSAGRNSFSFFLLLIVCMGYGVVKHSLGKTMVYARWLAITHFVFGVLYAVTSLSITPESAGPLVLLVVLPLAATLTAFYVWTLNSLGSTMKDLRERKQTVKAAMYRRLWWCILLSIVVIFIFFFINSWTLAGQSAEDFVPTHWKTRWFILDGWLNLVFFFDVAFIAYVWRPTANNRRFAMSDEIAQDDDGFDLASRDSLDIEDADIAPSQPGSAKQPPLYSGLTNRNRDVSPLPAPQPTKPAPIPRASLDGETMFAIEDEDKFSDDDEDDEAHPHGDASERQRLTEK